jgi:hypothetical protein
MLYLTVDTQVKEQNVKEVIYLFTGRAIRVTAGR